MIAVKMVWLQYIIHPQAWCLESNSTPKKNHKYNEKIWERTNETFKNKNTGSEILDIIRLGLIEIEYFKRSMYLKTEQLLLKMIYWKKDNKEHSKASITMQWENTNSVKCVIESPEGKGYKNT
jgi:hypothetical protein